MVLTWVPCVDRFSWLAVTLAADALMQRERHHVVARNSWTTMEFPGARDAAASEVQLVAHRGSDRIDRGHSRVQYHGHERDRADQSRERIEGRLRQPLGHV